MAESGDPATALKDKSFSAETVACLLASLQKTNPTLKINYGIMSALSAFGDSSLTKSAIEHQFRAVKKRATDLLAKETEIVEGGGHVKELPAARKRGATNGDSEGSPGTPKKRRITKTEKNVKREDDVGNDSSV